MAAASVAAVAGLVAASVAEAEVSVPAAAEAIRDAAVEDAVAVFELR